MSETDPRGVRQDDDGVEITPSSPPDERRRRAERIRQRSVELIDALGPDHPLVAQALARADELDAEADEDGLFDLR